MAAPAVQALPVLVSMSMASQSEEESSQASTPGFTCLPFCVKNTFIDVCEDSPSLCLMRQSVSAPATPRGHTSSSPSTVDLLPFNFISPKMCSATSASEDSTSAFDSDETDFSDDASTTSVGTDAVGVALSLSELLAPPVRTKLSTRAKAWAPCQSKGIGPSFSPEVKGQFAEITAAAQAALMKCASVQQVATTQKDTAWSLEATCQLQHLVHAQPTLEFAKLALKRATEQSKNIYIVGYAASPFKASPTGLGFSVQLAMVDEEASICWDVLTTGNCHRGCSCRWKHPEKKVLLNVRIKCA